MRTTLNLATGEHLFFKLNITKLSDTQLGISPGAVMVRRLNDRTTRKKMAFEALVTSSLETERLVFVGTPKVILKISKA